MDETTLDPEEAAAAAAPTGARASGRTLAAAGLIVTVASLVSRILGYVRYVVIAKVVHDTASLDAFFAAFRIPDFLFQLVAAGALAAALIPVLASLFASGEDARAWRVASTIATLLVGVLTALVVVAGLLAPILVPMTTPGFADAQVAQTVQLTQIMLLSPLFLAAGAIATTVLNAAGRFTEGAVAPLAYNSAIILGALLLVPQMGVAGLAVGVVLGSIGNVLVQIPGLLKARAQLRPMVDLKDSQTRRAITLLGPRALGLGATQLIFLAVTYMASNLEPGSIAVFSFAFAVLQIPLGVIGVPLGTVLLPSLSREAALGAGDRFRHLVHRGLGILSFVMVATAGLGIVLAHDVTRLLFGSSAISAHDIDRTAQTLAILLVGLTAHSMISVLARAFYALQDTATPVIGSLLAVVGSIGFGAVFVGPFGVVGLGLGIAIATWTEAVLLVYLLGRRVPGLGLSAIWVVIAKTVAAAAVGALAAWGVETALVAAWSIDPGFVGVLVRVSLATAVGTAVLVVAALALRIDELRHIVGVMTDLARRRARA